MDLGPTLSSWTADRPIYAPDSRTVAFTLQRSLATTHYFISKYYQVLIATHLPSTEGWKTELALAL